ncbi:MAG: hypothetical protein RIS43_618, partial [Actinomycetota bacterium]
MSFIQKFQQPKAPLSRDFIVLTSVVVGLCITGMVMVTSASSVVSMRETGSAWNYAQK